jgi:molecular chaperone DnaK
MELILGVDFGTTNTVVSFFENNKPNILTDGIYKCIPSKIGIKNNILYFGNYLPIVCDELFNNFKTKIGNNFEIKNNDIILKETDILIYFFNHIKKIIQKNIKKDVNFKSVITVPSNFNDNQREKIKNAFNYCGFNVIKIINEPSAAALAYGLNNINENEERILVVDLGGGTLDLTVLLKENGFFEVEHSTGLNNLGGNNFTDLIFNYVIKKYPTIIEKNKKPLWYVCQNVKEKLSYIDDYQIKLKNYNGNNEDLLLDFDSKIFQRLSYEIIDEYTNILKTIKTNYEDIKYIVMVGNSSKIPILQDKIKEIFDIKPWIYPNLESVVSEGACLYGAISENKYEINTNVLLVDVVPLSLGVETCDGLLSIIIPKNTPLPAKRTQKYTSDTPFDDTIKIKVYQGERKVASKNTLIGEYIFNKVSLSCKPIIDITFKVDTNGIINITILDKKSNVEKNILIKDIPVINSEELDNILKIAEQNQELDEEETLIKNRTYLIKTKIEIILNNIKLNELLQQPKKEEIIKHIIDLENKCDEATNSTILLNILKELDEHYCTYTNVQQFEEDHKGENIEHIVVQEMKETLLSKVTILLNKNPEWEEYLKPILDELNYSNVTKEYLVDKLEIINDLDDNNENIDYREQLKNLCLFLKSEIEVNNIIISEDKLEVLINLIDETLNILDINDDDINWEQTLNNFNETCENIYNINHIE